MTTEVCHNHSGCITDIENLKKDNVKQWEEISKVNDKVDQIMSRLNVVLGSIVVACVMLAINLITKG